MENQKIANLLNDETNQSYKFRTRNWVEINDDGVIHTLLISTLNLKRKC